MQKIKKGIRRTNALIKHQETTICRLTRITDLGIGEHCKGTTNDRIINYRPVKSYLSGRRDNILSVGFALQGLRQFAEEVNAHFNCIEVVFAFCRRGGGGHEQRWQGGGQATDHCERRKSRCCALASHTHTHAHLRQSEQRNGHVLTLSKQLQGVLLHTEVH